MILAAQSRSFHWPGLKIEIHVIPHPGLFPTLIGARPEKYQVKENLLQAGDPIFNDLDPNPTKHEDNS